MEQVERPEVGARVVYVPGFDGTRGNVIAVGELRGARWAAMVEWDEGAERRSPEAFSWEAFLVGLVVVEAPAEREPVDAEKRCRCGVYTGSPWVHFGGCPAASPAEGG